MSRRQWLRVCSAFALALLLFAVPIPDVLLSKAIYALQAGSADIAELFFNLSGAPVLRQGFFFRLPVISIEVAQECSGIRSSLALLILALLVAHFSFRPFWKKLAFVVAGLCMMLVKNGIRIATLTLLANYVNPSFLTGSLHHQGGIVFFLIGLALLVPVYWGLRKGEGPLRSLPSSTNRNHFKREVRSKVAILNQPWAFGSYLVSIPAIVTARNRLSTRFNTTPSKFLSLNSRSFGASSKSAIRSGRQKHTVAHVGKNAGVMHRKCRRRIQNDPIEDQ
jgi:exosortase/archaeosortase family protein